MYSRGDSILPNILDIFKGDTWPKKGRPGEYRANCPFCGDKERKLYLNTEKNTFKCYHGKCISNGSRQGGGVVKFIALLENKTENHVIEEIKQQHREESQGLYQRPIRKMHPAEKLNAFQLTEMGYTGPSIYNLRRIWADKNPQYLKATLDHIWQSWQAKVQYETENAYKQLIIGLAEGNYNQTVEEIKKRGEELGVDLLTPVLKVYCLSNPPSWVIEAKKLAYQWLKPYEKDKTIKLANAKLKQAGSR